MPMCAYCGARPGTTSDHVPPKGFFPSPLPSDMVTIPSCDQCNGGFSKDEEYVRNVIAAGLDGEASSVGFQVFDSKVVESLTRRDGALLRRIASSIHPVEVYSGNLYLGNRPAIHLETDRYVRVMEKICRGLFYRVTGSSLGSARIMVVDIDKVTQHAEVAHGLGALASQFEHGSHPEVFRYKYRLSDKDPRRSAWLLQFYMGDVVLVVTSSPNEEP